MYEKVNLPQYGYTSENNITILELDVAVGQRDEFSTELFVRGAIARNNDRLRFCGSTVLREGRDYPDHDIEVYGRLGKMDNDLADRTALAVDTALGSHAAKLMEDEINRICE